MLIDTKAYILRSFIDDTFFYVLFFSISQQGTKKRRAAFISIFLIMTFLVELYSSLSDIIPILAGYFILKTKGKRDYVLLNELLVSILILYDVTIFSSTIMMQILPKKQIVGFSGVFLQLFIEVVVISSILFYYKRKNLHRLIEKYSSEVTAFLLVYLALVTMLIAYTAHYYDAYDQFVVGIVVFVTIQTLFVTFLFIRALNQQKVRYEEKMAKQEMAHLKKYTATLEQQEQQMIKFKSDYQKRLCDFKEASNTEQNDKLNLTEQIQALEHYSDKCLSKNEFDDQLK